MELDKRLRELELELPGAPRPAGAYVPVRTWGNLAITAGMLPLRDGQLTCTGQVGAAVDVATAQDAARLAILNGLAALRAELGGFESVETILRVEGYIASAPMFTDQAKVLNGASELLVDLGGPPAVHSRVAVGVTRLPLDATVEVALWIGLRT